MVRFGFSSLLLLVAAGVSTAPARAQAVVEAAILGSAAGAAAPGAKGAGAASAGVFEAVRKALAGATQAAQGGTTGTSPQSSSSATVITLDPPSAKAKAAVQPKDVSGITVGLTREELLERFGPPALKTSESNSDGSVETYTYMQSKTDSVIVTLRGGVVSSKTEAPRSKQVAVVTLP